MVDVLDQAQPYMRQYAAARAALPGAGLAWLGTLRDDAIGRFGATGFPTNRVEDWKYTSLARMTRTVFGDAAATETTRAALAPWLMPDGACHCVVFVNGRHAPALSDAGALPAGVTISSLGAIADADPGALEAALEVIAGAEDDALADLNTALMRDGVVLRLASGTTLERPVHVVHFNAAGTAPGATHTRNLVLAGAGSRATVIETYAGADTGAYWTNAVTRIALDPGAGLSHVVLQREGAEAYHVARTRVRIDREASYRGFMLSTGARLARDEIRMALVGEGADAGLTGGVLVRGRQHADITTEVDHRVGHGSSRQLIKNVLDDSARSVFQGSVVVRPQAQKIDAGQTNRNLLLSRKAQAASKPELRILADDVKCSHGATTGELDEQAMFYLKSRGIGEDEARALLVRAFVGELLEAVEGDAVNAHVESVLAGWLGATNNMEIAA